MFDQIKNNPHGQRVFENAKHWLNNAPLFTISLPIISIAFFIISLIFGLSGIFGNMASATLGKLQIYRLIIFPFINRTFFELLFGVLLYLPILNGLEKNWGTIKTITYFVIKNVEIGIAYCIVSALLSNFYHPLGKLPSCSVWPIFFCNITQKSIQKSDEFESLFQLPIINIKAKYYPWIMAILYLLIVYDNSFIPVDIIIAIGLGFLTKFTDPYYMEFLTDSRIYEIEQNPKLARVKTSHRFISIYQNLQANLINNDSIRDSQLSLHSPPLAPLIDNDAEKQLKILDNIQYNHHTQQEYPKVIVNSGYNVIG